MNNIASRRKTNPPQQNIAVLIDAENTNNVPSIDRLIRILEREGEIVAKRAIGDWNRNIQLVGNEMQKLGIDLIQQTNFVPKHNLADIRLAIEAIEILHNPRIQVDTFAVVSSDQDFIALYERLRELGKSVIVAANPNSSTTYLKRHSDRFIPIKKTQQPQNPSASKSTKKPKSKPRGQTVTRNRLQKGPRTRTRKLILSAMESAANEHGVAQSHTLYNTMRRLQPGFSVRKLGYSTFAKLLRSYRDIVAVRGRRAATTSIKLRR